MEQELADTKAMALTAASAVLYGEGWAALENLRREKRGMPPLCPHLDFGTTGEDQAMWKALVLTGSLQTGDDDTLPPPSYQRRPEWVNLLKKAAAGPDRYYWKTHYMIACAALANGDPESAERALDASCSCRVNAWNTYARAELFRIRGDGQTAARTVLAAAGMAKDDDSLCKMTARMLANAGMWQVLRDFTEGLSDPQKALPRIRFYRALAAQKLGRTDEAEALLYADGGLEIPDIQEGETSITGLWFDIAEQKAKRDGIPFDRASAKPPMMFDFRMNVTD
jgi:hypothetical protein